MHIFQKIRASVYAGKTYSQIARDEGLDRKTVRKYASLNQPPKYSRRGRRTRGDPVAGFAEQITGLVERAPNLSGSEVYEWLVVRGYQGSERSVQRHMKQRRDRAPKDRDFEQTYEPGEQAQFDFKESLELPFLSGPRVVHLHFSTLPFSDKCVVRAYPHKNYECYMEGIHSFFETIGGMPKNIRFDNLSPVVKKVLPDGGRLYTKKFKVAHEYYGFGLLPCSPRRGNEKGDVERDIQTVARRFLNHIKVEGLKFRDFAELNEHLRIFLNQRESQETAKKFATEVEFLMPLPARDEDILCRSEECRASDLGTVTLMKSTYSVPDEVIGQQCWVVPGPHEVKIYQMDTRKLVATHPRKEEGEHSILLAHCLRSLLRKPRAMIRWSHREILFPDEVLRRFYDQLKRQDDFTAEREFLRVINLVQVPIPIAEVVAAVSLVLEVNQVSYDSVRELLLVERRPADIIDITQRFKQEPIRPDLEAYNQLIPKSGGG